MKNLEFNLNKPNEAEIFAYTVALFQKNRVKFSLLQDKCPSIVAIVIAKTAN